VPCFETISPEFKKSMTENLFKLTEAESIYEFSVREIVKSLVVNNSDGSIHISISGILKSPSPQTITFEILKSYGFSSKLALEVFENLHGISGQVYYTETKRLIKDRDYLIITDIANQQESRFYVDANELEIEQPIKLKFTYRTIDGFIIPKNKNIAALDADKITFPLMFRKWQMGDYFQPLGMNGMKKLSDFYVDQKLSLADKENTWVMTSAGDIAWVVDLRPDDRFKITTHTHKVLLVEYVK
jgi:tRNA(Ile)-lysidine synthase